MRKIAFHALALAAALFPASFAAADTVTATLNNCGPAEIVTVHYDGQNLGQGYAGFINWTATASSGSTAPTGNFSTFCIDLTQDIYIGSGYSFTITDMTSAPDPTPPTFGGPGMGPTNAQDITNLYAEQYSSIGSDSDKAAAFQIAIWEMLYETGTLGDITSGNFYVTGQNSNVTTLADDYVTAALGAGNLTFSNEILAMSSSTAQDQLFIGPPNPQYAPVVPTPAALIGGIPLLGALAAARKIKRRSML
jgi:hypothetical protein